MTDKPEPVTGTADITLANVVSNAKGLALTPEQADLLSAPNGHLYREALQIVEGQGTEAVAAFIADLEELARRAARDRWVPNELVERFVWWATQAGKVATAALAILKLLEHLT